MRPLEGLRVIDLARVLAGPYAAMILAEMGADVIKVERPGLGDETRAFEPFVGNESAYFFACNRSKRSITVNLAASRGQEVIRRLVRRADVLIENFPVGSLARYGLDYRSIRDENPRLIYASCTAFGQTGPYAERKGYDTVFQAMGGLMSLTGEVGGGPVKAGLPIADLTTALWLVVSILGALAGRSVSGEGEHIDFAMLDGQVSLLTLAAARYFALGEVPERLGTEHPGRVPSASFRCRDGDWLHITCSDQHWGRLCRILDLDDWAVDPDLLSNAGRLERRVEVMTRLTAAINARERDALYLACVEADVPAGPVNAVDVVFSDPQVQAREMVTAFDHPTVGSFPALSLPFASFGHERERVGRPPLLGEHTDLLLTELGYDADDISSLRAEKVV